MALAGSWGRAACGALAALSTSSVVLAPLARASDAPDAMRTADDYRWEHRVLIIWAARDSDALVRQLSLLSADEAGLTERDLVVLQVSADRVFALFGDDDAPSIREISSAYGAPATSGFSVRLIGKDGGVKLTADAPITLEDLFQLIDAMPMRLQEMRLQEMRIQEMRGQEFRDRGGREN